MAARRGRRGAQACARASLIAAGLGAAWVVAAEPAAAPARTVITGFAASSAAGELALEERFDAALSAEDLREWLRRISSGPNFVGAPHNKENAELVVRLFRAWG